MSQVSPAFCMYGYYLLLNCFLKNSSYIGALHCVCFGDCSIILSIFRANYNNNPDKTNGTVKTLPSPRKPIIHEELSGVNLGGGRFSVKYQN